MNVYAIGYIGQEGVYHNFYTGAGVKGLRSTCILPTRRMADKYLEESLSHGCRVIKIKITTVGEGKDRNILGYERDIVREWDKG